MNPQRFELNECMQLGGFVRGLLDWFQYWLLGPVARVMGSQPEYIPSDLGAFRKSLENQFAILWHGNVPRTINELNAPLLKRAILNEKKLRAEKGEQLRKQIKHAQLTQAIDEQMTFINGLVKQEWFSATIPLKLPRLTDYLTLNAAYKALNFIPQEVEAKFDDKFGFLHSQSEFMPRMKNCRIEAWLRSTTTSVVFIDIDKFKAFNKKYSETAVDREMLPRVMQELEAHIYSHGWAYRFGGDEFVLLLPNTETTQAERSLFALRKKLLSLRFFGDANISVSIGMRSFGADSPLTDQEILHAANRAESYAKEIGGDCIIVSEDTADGLMVTRKATEAD